MRDDATFGECVWSVSNQKRLWFSLAIAVSEFILAGSSLSTLKGWQRTLQNEVVTQMIVGRTLTSPRAHSQEWE